MSTRSSGILSREITGISECMDRLASRKFHDRPVSTYRLQFHANFRFSDALAIVPYLHALGVSHCYSSPILKARSGSMHGYDITDHNALNPEIGTEAEFRQFVAGLKSRGMGLILDTVPNHMGVGYGDNPWWQDVLENGRSSEFASFFDIDWEPVKTELCDKVLIPILGNQYGAELESGRIKLTYDDGRFLLRYYDKTLPIDLQTVPMIFEPIGDLRAQQVRIGLLEAERTQLENLLWDMRQLPPHTASDPDQAALRARQVPELRNRFCELVERAPRVRELVDAAIKLCNGDPGQPRSFDALHRLLEGQAYRLAHWRVSAQEINYRRFFDINDLVGLRMENPKVFAATHRFLRKLLADGLVSGIRLDHPDGLLNPVQYFTRVQMLYAASQCCGPEAVPPVAENGIEIEVQDIFGQHDWMSSQAPLYVLVEKILEHGEELPPDWPVDGSVGYDFANLVNGIFIDQRNSRFFTGLYRRFIGGPVDVDTLIYEAKMLIMRTALSSEVTVLSHLLEEIASTDRHARDFTRPALTDAIREVIACFPVYRTYIDERGNVSDRDRQYIVEAVARAKRRNPSTTTALFDFLRDILLLNIPENVSIDLHRRRLNFTLKFQQLTGPVMAKGLEDTVFYVYNRFVSVNEVGGSPAEFGRPVEEFHRANSERAEHWRFSMLATSTHDTKRSEDVRARLNVLSEMPRPWAAQVMRWRRSNRARKRSIGDGRLVPDPNEEFQLYQTLVGVWPLQINAKGDRESFVQRIKAYMTKAVHEAKVNLSWVNQNPEYVQALEQFIERILRPG
ncbi:MAG TPA: malto-oligosyltrehalose synthase, partial [Terriglobales bacterium]|nr:malto-oligosyltrehalose synthase [Terriglobales bacterium]